MNAVTILNCFAFVIVTTLFGVGTVMTFAMGWVILSPETAYGLNEGPDNLFPIGHAVSLVSAIMVFGGVVGLLTAVITTFFGRGPVARLLKIRAV